MNTLGERIVFLREKQDISQKELAKQLEITAATLSRYENNIYDPKGEILAKLCTFLHTNADYLLGMTDNYRSREETFSLSAKEIQLLEIYRSLTPEYQIRIEERLLTLHDIQCEDNSPMQ